MRNGESDRVGRQSDPSAVGSISTAASTFNAVLTIAGGPYIDATYE